MASVILTTFTGALIYLLAIAVPFILFIISYQLLSHPLKNYPGPLAAKLTHGYEAFYGIRHCLHLTTYKCHLKYGPVVRLGPDRLVFNTMTAIHDIYTNPNVNKGRAYLPMAQGKITTMWITPDRRDHRRKRKLIAPVISERSMRSFEPQMLVQIDIFLRQLLRSSHQGDPINMTRPCERLAVDIIGQLAFGFPLKTQTEETNQPISDSLKAMSNLNTLLMAWPAMTAIAPLMGWLGRKKIGKFYQALHNMIKSRKAMTKDAKHDFYALATGEINPGEYGLSDAELWPEAVFIMAAGGGTVHTALTVAFFYLSRYPTAYARLAAEVRTTFSSGRDICQGPQLASCKYLRAVIDEALRIAPSSLQVTWREQDESSVRANEPLVVDGHVIPPGTQVAVNLYCLMHNEKYFSDPFVFHPERWLVSQHATAAEREAHATMRRAFQPFVLGDRGCAGKAMAYLELSLAIAKTMWYFDFEKAPGKTGRLGEGLPGRTDGRGRRDEFQLYDGIVVAHEGPNLEFKPRGEFWKELKDDGCET
ncbi:cytochrome P450 [Camillea tinctor]|nr:cytochrome P450 [Camillea tinctor]